MEGQPQIIYKKRSFSSQAALGLTLIVVAVIASGTAVVLYGMSILDGKTDDLFGFVQATIEGLPEIRKSLPPVVADVLSDRRSPEYRNEIDVGARLLAGGPGRAPGRLVLEVTNNGTELVSLLSLRVVGTDEDGGPTLERNVWAATPIAADGGWPGPLMPGARRVLTAQVGSPSGPSRGAHARFDIEITDVRVWVPEGGTGESGNRTDSRVRI
ncbi:MAG: hypothetical protein JXP34_10295 [Planctomycetes bacterium]|nr:hypothetical protein [Planctomycetota bacterium]